MDIMVMERNAMTAMNAVVALVTRTQFVEIQTVHIAVAAIPASRVTEFHALIMMSAKRMLTTVTRKLSVITPGAHNRYSCSKGYLGNGKVCKGERSRIQL